MNSKRLNFIRVFLKLYDVQKIKLIEETEKIIRGIAIYDEFDPDERQEFIWKIRESETPSKELNQFLEVIINQKLYSGDKLNRNLEKIEFANFDNSKKQKLLKVLFKVEINMIDNGKKTDSYFVHY